MPFPGPSLCESSEAPRALVLVGGSAAPAGYGELRVAFAAASRLPPEAPVPAEGWRVGVCNDRGECAAWGVLDSFAQLCSFLAAVEAAGHYRALLCSELAARLACDLLLHRAQAPRVVSRPEPG